MAGVASIEGLRRVRAVNAVRLDVENAVFVGLRRFGKESCQKVVGVGGKPG